jgi:predicted MPP superfamily phosphohydrolase
MSVVRLLAFFFFSSGLAHLLVARWLLSTFSPAKHRERRLVVYGLALLLSLMLGTARLVASMTNTRGMYTLIALAMVELTAVLIVLLPLGGLTVVARVIARLARRRAARAADAAGATDAGGTPDAAGATDAGGTPDAAGATDAGGTPDTPPEGATPREVPTLAAAADVVTRRQAVEQLVGVSFFGATGVALGWGMVRGRHAFALEEVVVKVKDWPRALDGYVIVQVSDVHLGAFVGERDLDEGFELVKRARPDLLVATGDLVDFDADAVDPLAQRLVRAQARDGAYAVLGNHDHYAGATKVLWRLEAIGVRALCNQSVLLRAGDGGGFGLVGVDDEEARSGRYEGFGGPDLGRAVRSLNPERPRILLAHRPPFFGASAGRVALQLSGHTHGGQINFGFRPAELVMKYVAGRYERDGSTLYVNRGFGVAGPPSRVGAPPEITRLVIVAG